MTELLEDQAATQIQGSQIDNYNQVFSETVMFYFSLLRTYYIDHEMSLQSFEQVLLNLLIKAGKRIFPSSKAICLPITKEIPLKVIRH